MLCLVVLSAVAQPRIRSAATADSGMVCSFIPSPDSPSLFTVPWVKWVVRGAQAIVRVHVIGLWPNTVTARRAIEADSIQASVLEVLAGSGVPDTLLLFGRSRDSDVYPSESIPYLDAGYSTTCYRAEFRRRGEHLLLLWRREDSTWTSFGPPFAPSMIQVKGADDPWIQWVMGVRTGRIP
jgi:hypothetical protein